jgi:hypothetical protein
VRSIRALAVAGAVIVVAATFVPINGGGDAGYATAIFDRSVQREVQLFALEPLAVAFLVVLVVLLLLRRRPEASAGVLLGVGLQTAVLFLAYTAIALFGNPAYNSFEPAGPMGVIGAVLIGLAGVGGLRWRDSRTGGSHSAAHAAGS